VRGILGLTLASMGLGATLALVLTKPPVFIAAAKFVLGLLGFASHAV
jgi:hypothetical protein